MASTYRKITHVCIIGGSGFVGHHIAAHLTKAGYRVRVLTRNSARHRELRVLPNLEVVEANVFNESVLESQFSQFLGDHGAVINLVGILNQGRRPGRRFSDAHVALPQIIVEACQHTGVRRLLHMSALKADAHYGPSKYLRSKGEGETVVLGAEGLDATTFQPSVIFGNNDHFFNRFARLLALSPVFFPLACAEARFAPVFVEDVAEAFVRALPNPHIFGQSYALCGPRVYTLRELVAYTAQLTGRRRTIIGLGKPLSWLQGLLMEWLPTQPFSRDNYLSTLTDNVCDSPFPAVFNIKPKSVESIVPGYLGPHQRNARFDSLRRHAGRNQE